MKRLLSLFIVCVLFIGSLSFSGFASENEDRFGTNTDYSSENNSDNYTDNKDKEKHIFSSEESVEQYDTGIVITKQPTDITIEAGKSTKISITAEGSGLTYQWYYKAKGASSFTVWSGRTSASFSYTPALSKNGMQMYCIVKDSSGKTVQSDTITLTVETSLAGPSITKQPTDVTVEAGKSTTIGLTASGSGLTYQWYYKAKGASSFTVWSGRTSASFSYAPTASKNGMQMYCIVKDSNGKTVQSNTITLTVEASAAGPSITKQPTNVTTEAAKSVTIGLTASGSGLTYQWYYKAKGASSFTVWSGRTAASFSYAPTASKNGMQMYCIVKDSSGKSIQSNTITLTVEVVAAGPSITKQPANVTTEAGKSVTIGLTASGSGLSYQWYYKAKGASSFTVWSGRTSASFSYAPTASKNGMQMYCIVKDSNGKKVQSDTITLTVTASQPVTIPSVSSTYIFGSYEQDNNTANGKEPIEWIVLDKSGTKVMLISKFSLDCQLYNTESTDVTWETCSLRKWLNSTFINSAFSTAEKGKLVSTTVTADPNPQYSTDSGKNTTDKVYLLSITEAAKYFTSDEARMCVPTSYAIANGVWTGTYYTVGGKGTCWWWLRTSGDQSNHVAGVCASGAVDSTGPVNFDVYAVRPVIWIDLAS